MEEQVRAFLKNMERRITALGAPPMAQQEAFLAYQRSQVERLVELEQAYRQAVIEDPKGRAAYQRFSTFVVAGDRSILSARPFFRERQSTFAASISDAFRNNDLDALMTYRINHRWIRWMSDQPWSARTAKRLAGLRRDIERLREEIALLLLPLAVHRARIFWSRTPRSHLTFLDLVQICADGVMAAVDKFVPPFGRVFRAVAIGRMVGNLIEEYSETLLHFYPSDRRTIYRANKAVGRGTASVAAGTVDYERLARTVNKESAEKSEHTTAGELANLLAAASCVSSDAGPIGARRAIGRMAAPEEQEPDRQVERAEIGWRLMRAAAMLTLFERKFLTLKGLSLQEQT